MPQLAPTKFSYGWIPDRPSVHHPRITFSPGDIASLPTKQARFATGFPPIFDQGPIGSCTAHGLVRAYMFAAAKAGETVEMLSRLMLYYDERSIEGTTASDAGAAIADGVQTLQNDGCCREITWPYNVNDFTKRPPASAYSEAKGFQLLKAAKVDPTPGQIKAVLATGWPVVIGFTCFASLESQSAAQTGVVPIPTAFDPQIGGHCVCLSGYYDDAAQLIGFCNSWGTGWGDKGDGYMPYWFFQNGLVADCWVLYTVEGSLPQPTPPGPNPPTPTPTPGPMPIITVDSESEHFGVELFAGHTDAGRKVHGIYL